MNDRKKGGRERNSALLRVDKEGAKSCADPEIHGGGGGGQPPRKEECSRLCSALHSKGNSRGDPRGSEEEVSEVYQNPGRSLKKLT